MQPSDSVTGAGEAAGRPDLGKVETGRAYKLTEVAALLSVHRDTVGRLVALGELKTVRVGKRKRVLGSDLLAHIGLPAPPAMPDGPAERKRRAAANLEAVRQMMGKHQKPKGKPNRPCGQSRP